MSDSITIKADGMNLQPVTYDLIMNSINQDTVARIHAPVFNPQSNCRNCGAPLNRHRNCEYCGTPWQMDDGILVDVPKINNRKSELVVTANEIRMSVG